ncbi:MAG: electron transfer flavoprotein subunit alpha/FixB family protein [Eubacteriales bacterium]|nr:electron transfer flavoprotein subunit alpha/FixB family protein [Eubacteriales bacterium]
MQLTDYKGIWVFAEHRNGRISDITFELLAKAKELSDKNDEGVVAILLARDAGDMSQKLLNRGGDRVIVVESDHLKEYKAITCAKVLEALVDKYRPSILLFGATSMGKDLAPRVMAKLRTGLTADCMDLDIDGDGLLIQTKPSYGGNIMCKILCPTRRPQMATIRPKVFSQLEEMENPKGEIVIENISVEPENDYEILEHVAYETEGVKIEEAEIVVVAGRGVSSKDDMKMIEDLAKELHGAIAVTRPLVDAEWYDPSIQVGASGKTIKPKLIVNIGVSGAIQYNVGMQNAKNIVSINKSPKAPIFSISHYGIVGDYKRIVPLLTEEIKKTRSQ